MIRALVTFVLALALASLPAAAQEDYFAPGALGKSAETARERVNNAAQDARWQLGPIGLEPRLFVGDLRYVSNVYSTADEEAISDLQGAASAGLRAFFNLGPKILASPFLTFDYAWWREQTELRELGESYGLQLFGDFNHLQLEIQSGQIETQRNLSSEVEVPVLPRTRQVALDAEVRFWGHVGLFANFAQRETRFAGDVAEREVPGLVLSTIDSDGRTVSGGLSYEFGSLRVGLGYVESTTEYLDDPAGRSRRGSGPLLQVAMDGPRLSINLDASRRKLKFDALPAGREQLFGRGLVRWKFTERLSGQIYAGSSLGASALNDRVIFESHRTGLGASFEPNERSRLRTFVETGEDDYGTSSDGELERRDEFTSFGVSYRLLLTRRLTLDLGYSDLRRESSDPIFDRNLQSLTLQLSLGGSLLSW